MTWQWSLQSNLLQVPVFQMRTLVRGQYTWERIYQQNIAPLLDVSDHQEVV